MVATARSPAQPEDPRGFHGSGQEGVTGRQVLPTIRDLQFAVLGIPPACLVS
jgi:hypothetical protein